MEKNSKGFGSSGIFLDGAVLPLETDGGVPLVCYAGEGNNCPTQKIRDEAFHLELGKLLMGGLRQLNALATEVISVII